MKVDSCWIYQIHFIWALMMPLCTLSRLGTCIPFIESSLRHNIILHFAIFILYQRCNFFPLYILAFHIRLFFVFFFFFSYGITCTKRMIQIYTDRQKIMKYIFIFGSILLAFAFQFGFYSCFALGVRWLYVKINIRTLIAVSFKCEIDKSLVYIQTYIYITMCMRDMLQMQRIEW